MIIPFLILMRSLLMGSVDNECFQYFGRFVSVISIESSLLSFCLVLVTALYCLVRSRNSISRLSYYWELFMVILSCTALYCMAVCVPGTTARGDCELVLVDEARPNRHLQVICSKREQLTEVLILQTKVNPSTKLWSSDFHQENSLLWLVPRRKKCLRASLKNWMKVWTKSVLTDGNPLY